MFLNSSFEIISSSSSDLNFIQTSQLYCCNNQFTNLLNSRIKLKFSKLLDASFSQTTSSQTSVNIAVEQIIARQLNDDGIVQEVIHELAPPILTSQLSHPHAQADIYDFVPSNSMPAIIADNHTDSTFFGTLKHLLGVLYFFPRLCVVDSSCYVVTLSVSSLNNSK